MIHYRLPRLVEVRHIREHVLWLRYSDGVEGEIDLGDELTGPVLEPLRDVTAFATALVEDGELAWPNGADWSPEDLRERLGASYECVEHWIDDDPTDPPIQISDVPEICRFYGIVLRMLLSEHSPPHFHAVYGEYEVSVDIEDGAINGGFPPEARRLVLEWRSRHQRELMTNWDLLRAGRSPRAIQPLE